MTTCTLGFERDDGDFQVLATLNNNDDIYDEHTFLYITNILLESLCQLQVNQGLHDIFVITKQVAPDYITDWTSEYD